MCVCVFLCVIVCLCTLTLFMFLCVLGGVKVMLDRIGGEIVDFATMFPVEASLANFTIFLNQGQQQIESNYAQIDQLDFYRSVCVCVSIFVRV